MSTTALLLALSLAQWTAGAEPAGAASHVVPDDFATVQSAIDAAASGDSILVRSGTYVEALTLAGKDLVIAGEGAATTILTTNATGRILDVGTGVTPATLITGFTFDRGTAFDGGAVRIASGSGCLLRACWFTNNTVYQPGGASRGGAIHSQSTSRLLIEDCEFRRNAAYQRFDGTSAAGGAVAADGSGRLTIRRSLFEQNVAQGFEGGAGPAVLTSAATEIDSCVFNGNSGLDGAIRGSQTTLAVRNSIFRSNGSGFGASAIDWEAWECCSLTVENNMFTDNGVIGPVIHARGTGGRITGNTLAFNRQEENYFAAGLDLVYEIVATHNVITNNRGVGIKCEEVPAGWIDCNDVWNNTGANYGGDCGDRTGIDGNISTDPLFCDGAARDLRLRNDSPCAPGGTECGLIGALGVGCGTAAVPDVAADFIGPATLEAVAPNPSRGSVEIAFSATAPMSLSLEVFDVLGRRQAVLSTGVATPGRHVFRWPASEARPRPGVYFAVLRGEGLHQRRGFIVVD